MVSGSVADVRIVALIVTDLPCQSVVSMFFVVFFSAFCCPLVVGFPDVINGGEMKKYPEHPKVAGHEPLVKSETIAALLSVSSRYVYMLGDQGRFPVYRISPHCVRYRVSEVMKALGIPQTPTG